MTTKVDPSVTNADLVKRMEGEPRGSVPLERTVRKPEAYSKPSKIKLPEDRNP